MNRSGIEYLDYSWSPITGCLHGPDTCPIVDDCWARAYANRFRARYGPGFRPALHISHLNDPLARKKPARIGVSFMGDFCGPQVHRHWQAQVLEVVRRCPQHQFVFLTKEGFQLQYFKWPDNCWVGVSITGALPEVDRHNLAALKQVQAPVRWVSFEPLLGPGEGDLAGIQWVVIGSQSGPHARQPHLEWVGDIMEQAGRRGIPLWMKRNLSPPWAIEDLCQELPVRPGRGGEGNESVG
mgnify:FL=1